mmetsp:Transcript_610/g.1316  ORF Transcript_610/g.1316 Transcript_610/m.1316 type:complete len:114 (-) Transcript_610:97-438(-)
MKVKTGRGRRISGKKKYTKIRVLRGCKLLSGTHAWVIQFLLLAKSTNVHCPAEIFAFGSSKEIGSTKQWQHSLTAGKPPKVEVGYCIQDPLFAEVDLGGGRHGRGSFLCVKYR